MPVSTTINTNSSKKIAAFDVCGTIYKSNTTFDFLKYYFQDNEKYTIFSRFINTLPVILINKAFILLFKIDFVRFLATSFLKGERLYKLESAGKDFVANYLKDRFISPIIQLLRKYKDKGYRIVLISGSYDFIVKYAAEEVGADAYFASVLSEKNGVIKGTYKEDLLNKKKGYIFSQYGNIEELVFVTDNRSDLDLIELADTAYIVTPQKKIGFWIKQGIPERNLIII